MIGNQGKIVLNHLQRAIAAEEKQGCCNTGVIGGFHLFLKGILSRLEQLEKDGDFNVLKDITNHYKDWSPLQRRQALAHLRRFIEEHEELEAQGQAPPVYDSLKPVNLEYGGPGISKQPQQPKPSDIPPASEPPGSDKKERLTRPTPPRSLQFLKGVGPERAKLLAQIGLHTVKDLFFIFPVVMKTEVCAVLGNLRMENSHPLLEK